MRGYKRLVSDLDLLENIVFAALKRQNEEDLRMTRMVGEIAREIQFKLPPPVVSRQSQAYFHTYPLYNLLSVPQKEVDFLLRLPDLHHELGHFVLLVENNPTVEPFQSGRQFDKPSFNRCENLARRSRNGQLRSREQCDKETQPVEQQ